MSITLLLRWHNVHARKETLFVREYLVHARFVLGHFLEHCSAKTWARWKPGAHQNLWRITNLHVK
jgi:hypothetical protein